MGRRDQKSGQDSRKRRLFLWFSASGLTYRELAERTGYGVSTVCHIVRGKRLKRPFSRRCKGKIVATLVWLCKKAGRDPRSVTPIAKVKCACGREHLVYATNGQNPEQVIVLTKSLEPKG